MMMTLGGGGSLNSNKSPCGPKVAGQEISPVTVISFYDLNCEATVAGALMAGLLCGASHAQHVIRLPGGWRMGFRVRVKKT